MTNNHSLGFQQFAAHSNTNKKKRNISKQPYKILEAPMLKDDFYLNLIDWSHSNQIAVGLQ
jgi:cell division cycle 20-like protein 1 (cofactor of APC complex)